VCHDNVNKQAVCIFWLS